MAADASDNQESRWWYREFERKIPILLEQGVGGFIGGDARKLVNSYALLSTPVTAVKHMDRVAMVAAALPIPPSVISATGA